MKISACIIAKNEARCIQRCIGSLLPAFDEVVLVDTGSTDDTVALAEALGAKVYHVEWRDDFSYARNIGIDHATGDWIVVLDADEWFPEGEAARFGACLRKIEADPSITGVCLRLHNLMREGEPTVYMPALRAFRRRPSIRYHGAVHEHLLEKGQPLKQVLVPPAEATLMHDSYAGARGREKPGRNLAILEKMAAEGCDDPLLPYYLASSHTSQRQYGRAWEHLRRFLQANPEGAGPVVLSALLQAQTALRRVGPASPGAAEDRAWLAGEATRRFAHHPTAWLIAGNERYEAQDPAGALPLYQKALQLHEGYHSEGERSENLAREAWPGVQLRAALCHEAAGDTAAALAACGAALDLQPDFPTALQSYVRLAAGQEARTLGAALLARCDAGAPAEACLRALWSARCDLAYLLVYDRYLQTGGARGGHYHTTMQVVMGEGEAATSQVVARVLEHPLWCGAFGLTVNGMDPGEREDLQLSLVEATAGALAAAKAPLLEGLLPAVPPALQDALALCLGREVETLHTEGAELLSAVRLRLTAHLAAAEVLAMWDEVLALFYGGAGPDAN